MNYTTGLAKNIVIETARLVLRPVSLEDAEDMFEFASDEENTYFVYSKHGSLKDTKNNIADFFMSCPLGKYGIELKDSKKLIGNIEIRVNKEYQSAEIGYILNKNFQKQGYMTEAAEVIIKLGFEELKLHKIFSSCDERNTASSNVMKRVGMMYEGTQRHVKKWKENEWINHEHYSIVETDYFQKR